MDMLGSLHHHERTLGQDGDHAQRLIAVLRATAAARQRNMYSTFCNWISSARYWLDLIVNEIAESEVHLIMMHVNILPVHIQTSKD